MTKALEEFTGVRRLYFLGRRKRQEYVKVRALFAYLLRSHEKMSYPAIGRLFRRDHSSIRNLVEMVLTDDELMTNYNLFLISYKKEYDEFIKKTMVS